jgi:hypothetical protein
MLYLVVVTRTLCNELKLGANNVAPSGQMSPIVGLLNCLERFSAHFVFFWGNIRKRKCATPEQIPGTPRASRGRTHAHKIYVLSLTGSHPKKSVGGQYNSFRME